MNAFRLLPVIISLALLAAHFYRAGQLALVMVMFVLLLFLVIKKPWLPRLIQVVLLFGALDWLRTLLSLAHMRMESGMPWIRLAVILGTVAIFTAFSGLVFRHNALKKRYAGTSVKQAE